MKLQKLKYGGHQKTFSNTVYRIFDKKTGLGV